MTEGNAAEDVAGGGEGFATEETVELPAGPVAWEAEDGLGLLQMVSTKRTVFFLSSSFPLSIVLNS